MHRHLSNCLNILKRARGQKRDSGPVKGGIRVEDNKKGEHLWRGQLGHVDWGTAVVGIWG